MDVAPRVPEAAILFFIKVTNEHKFVSSIIEGEVRRGRDRLPPGLAEGWRIHKMTPVVPLLALLGCLGLPPALPRHSLGFSWTSLGPPGTPWEAFGGPRVVF